MWSCDAGRVACTSARAFCALHWLVCLAAWRQILAEPSCAVNADGSHVWPIRDWDLRVLSEEQYDFWEANGYLVVQDVVPVPLARDASAAIREFVGADDIDPDTWYRNTLDVYDDLHENGTRPLHGPSGMVQLFHHKSLWALRQHPKVHAVFADLYGTHRLHVTADRAHFRPPEDPRFPAWSNLGPDHSGMHWDVNTSQALWPVPFAVQGVLYLEDTPADLGPLRVVPGFRQRFGEWSRSQAPDRDGLTAPEDGAISVAAPARSLVLWHTLVPHGPSRNTGGRPRVSAYVSMLPEDATPFLPPGSSPEEPLCLADAGSISYFRVDSYPIDAPEGERHSARETSAPRGRFESDGAFRPYRLSREERLERWMRRLPVLHEDPHEHELPRLPPGEEDGVPVALSELGERLVGLRDWE